MDGWAFERAIGRLMSRDFSAGTEAFRDDLLERCLSELDADNRELDVEISDAALDMLSAAGSPYQNPPQFGAGFPR